jgi:glycerol-1-phosphate dehydrogenase [NAD(P)+]
MPLLARTLLTPLTIEISAGAIGRLGEVLADRRITGAGEVAVVLGNGIGGELDEAVAAALPRGDIKHIQGGTLEAAQQLAEDLKTQSYDAVVGIGGGRVLDTVKYAATQKGMPMVAVATSLAHDGLASPVSSLVRGGHSISYGVHTPIAVIVDLDMVARSPLYQIQSGIGDAISNLCSTADWQLSNAATGEPGDGLALALALSGAEAVVNHPGQTTDQDFLAALANALILGGISMAVAGSSRPASGACHEISHALTEIYPDAASHGIGAGLGALFATYIRARSTSDEAVMRTFHRLGAAMQRHGLPRTPAEIGLTVEQFASVIEYAPATRPGRFTILEHLNLDAAAIAVAVKECTDALPS